MKNFNLSKIEPIIRDMPKIRRNQKCPCGSGLKYKKCCRVIEGLTQQLERQMKLYDLGDDICPKEVV